MPVDQIVYLLLQNNPEKAVTISGGEPLEQPGIVSLLEELYRSGASIVMFTGYEWSHICENMRDLVQPIIMYVDVLVAGPYDRTRHAQGDANEFLGLRGSFNQHVILMSGKYGSEDLMNGNRVEVIIDNDGVVVTGFPNKETVKALKASLEG